MDREKATLTPVKNSRSRKKGISWKTSTKSPAVNIIFHGKRLNNFILKLEQDNNAFSHYLFNIVQRIQSELCIKKKEIQVTQFEKKM